jgi:hypothetical protein
VSIVNEAPVSKFKILYLEGNFMVFNVLHVNSRLGRSAIPISTGNFFHMVKQRTEYKNENPLRLGPMLSIFTNIISQY